MGFGIGINTKATNASEIRVNQIEIACACWFTSKGKTIPYRIKFQAENGELQTIDNIHIKCTETKNYAGIPSVEYTCSIIYDMHYDVKLIFFKDRCKWVMNFL